MKYTVKLYYLYCLNIECQASIYAGMAELQIPSTAEKGLGIYTCSCCNQPLTAAIDAAIGLELKEVNSQKLKRQDYLLN
jgi:hypothetical protein